MRGVIDWTKTVAWPAVGRVARRIGGGGRFVFRRSPRHLRPHGPAVQSPSFVAAVGLVLALTAIGVLDPLVRLHPGIADGSFADRLLTAITSFGEGVQMLVGSALLVVAAASVDPAKLRRATRARVMNVAMVAGFAFVTIAGSGIVASLVKNIYGRARPEHLVGDAIFQLHSLSFRAKFASFPSGHSTTAGATAVVLALLFPRHARLILALGVGVAITRILLDAHFPADVVAGLTLGAVFTFAAAHWCARRGLIFRWAAGGSLALRPLARPMAWFDGLAAVLADRKRGGAAAPALPEIAPDAGSSGEKAASLDDAA